MLLERRPPPSLTERRTPPSVPHVSRMPTPEDWNRIEDDLTPRLGPWEPGGSDEETPTNMPAYNPGGHGKSATSRKPSTAEVLHPALATTLNDVTTGSASHVRSLPQKKQAKAKRTLAAGYLGDSSDEEYALSLHLRCGNPSAVELSPPDVTTVAKERKLLVSGGASAVVIGGGYHLCMSSQVPRPPPAVIRANPRRRSMGNDAAASSESEWPQSKVASIILPEPTFADHRANRNLTLPMGCEASASSSELGWTKLESKMVNLTDRNAQSPRPRYPLKQELDPEWRSLMSMPSNSISLPASSERLRESHERPQTVRVLRESRSKSPLIYEPPHTAPGSSRRSITSVSEVPVYVQKWGQSSQLSQETRNSIALPNRSISLANGSPVILQPGQPSQDAEKSFSVPPNFISRPHTSGVLHRPQKGSRQSSQEVDTSISQPNIRTIDVTQSIALPSDSEPLIHRPRKDTALKLDWAQRKLKSQDSIGQAKNDQPQLISEEQYPPRRLLTMGSADGVSISTQLKAAFMCNSGSDERDARFGSDGKPRRGSLTGSKGPPPQAMRWLRPGQTQEQRGVTTQHLPSSLGLENNPLIIGGNSEKF